MSAFRIRSVAPLSVLAASLLILPLLLPAPAYAADIPVTDGSDDGPDTLRQALAAANASGGQDVITIDPAVGTITLSSSVVITDGVTINGNGTTIARDGSFAMMVVDLATPGSVHLDSLDFEADASTVGRAVLATTSSGDDLTVTDSTFTGFNPDPGLPYYDADHQAGGAIKMDSGRLTISGTRFEANQAFEGGGAIWVGTLTGDSTITRSVFAENFTMAFDNSGGAGLSVRTIAPDVTLHVLESTFVGNLATGTRRTGFRGVAMNVGTVQGALIVDSSTFDHQHIIWPDTATAPSSGWSLGVDRVVSGGSVHVINSTFDEPDLGDPGVIFVLATGAVEPGATYTVDHSTIVGGGTLVIADNRGQSILRNTIAEGLSARNTVLVQSGNPVEVSYNAISSAFTPANVLDRGGNQFSVDDMMLQPLADNGGPTRTMMIGPVGPAVGTGMPTALPTEPSREQRGAGFLRRQGLLDIGAVELPGELPTLPLTDSPRTSTTLAATGSPVASGLLLAVLGFSLGGALVGVARRRAART